MLYLFEGFEVDTDDKSLKKAGQPVALTPKAFDTLAILVENAGTLMERSELMERIWTDRFVEEGNLSFNIKLVRRALGDDADAPRFIETVPRRGYRFIAPVRTASKDDPRDTPVPRGPRPRRQVALIAAVLLALVVVAVIGIVAFGRFNATREAFVSARLGRTTATGKSVYAAVSPDGKYIVHAESGESGQSLWIRQADESRDIEIVAPARGEFLGLTVAPDNQSVYYTFLPANMSDATLFQIPILGGTPKPIFVDLTSGVSFSPDGRQMAYYRTSPSRGTSRLFISAPDGAAEREVLRLAAPETFETDFGIPVWLGDGLRLVAIQASNLPGIRSKLIEIDVATGKFRQFADVRWPRIHQISSLKRSGDMLLAVFDEEVNASQIWLFDPASGRTRRISEDLSNYVGISVSEDERLLVTTRTEQITRLEIHGDGGKREIRSETGMLSGREGFAWMPDGRIVFRAESLGRDEIWIADGSSKRKLPIASVGNRQPAVCADGSIVFVANQGDVDFLWTVNADGTEPRRLTDSAEETELYPDCSAKGDWIAFQRGWRRPSIWKVPVTGGTPTQLTDVLSIRPTVSPDGRSVAFYELSKGGWSIAVVSIDSGERLAQFPIAPSVTSRILRWSPDGTKLGYADTRNGASNIWTQPIAGGPPSQLTEFESELIFSFDWSPDGSSVAFERGTIASDVVTIREIDR